MRLEASKIRSKYACSRRIYCLNSYKKYSKINAELGTNQIAETNAQPLELLSAVVRDANGLFQLDNIPPGRIDLFVDGRTVNPITAGNLQANDAAKPQYPSLHFEAYAIKGRDNQIAHPIYLPPLSTSPQSVKTVGGNQDVTLKISSPSLQKQLCALIAGSAINSSSKNIDCYCQ